MELNWNFQTGGGFKPKKLPWERHGCFLVEHILLIIGSHVMKLNNKEQDQTAILPLTDTLGWI